MCHKPQAREITAVCGGRQRVRTSILFVSIVVALIVASAGCGRYPTVSRPCFELAKALYTVCNLEDESQLTRVREMAQELQQADEISSREQKLLNRIVDHAEAGRWAKAKQQVRQLLSDQNTAVAMDS